MHTKKPRKVLKTIQTTPRWEEVRTTHAEVVELTQIVLFQVGNEYEPTDQISFADAMFFQQVIKPIEEKRC